jgi:hypothetical protein
LESTLYVFIELTGALTKERVLSCVGGLSGTG